MKNIESLDFTDQKPSKTMLLVLFAVFSAFAIFGAPFLYDKGNSGRYLLIVLKMIDPSLFPNDSVVNNISRFKSIFYLGIGTVFQACSIGVSSLEPFMFSLYIIIKIILVWSIWKLSSSITQNPLFFILLMAWACFPANAPIGGESSFKNEIIHSSIAELLCIGAIYSAIRKNYTFFWLLIAISIQVHSLMAIHLILCMGLPILILGGRADLKKHITGILIVIAGIICYTIWLAPPSMTATETQIFLNAKGDYAHVSPYTQSKEGWVALIFNILVIISLYKIFSKKERIEKLLLYSIVIGSVLALCFAVAAVHMHSARLAQFQPMRMFTWINVFIMILLSYYTISAFSKRSFIGLLLLLYISLNIIESGYLWAMMPILVLGIIAEPVKTKFASKEKAINQFLYLVLGLFAIGIIGAWLLKKHIPLSMVKVPLVLPFALLIIYSIYIWIKQKTIPVYLFYSAVIASLICGSIQWHWYYSRIARPQYGAETYKARIDTNWQDIEHWAQMNSNANTLFLIPNGEENFRTRSLRSCIGESMPALAWVSPLAYLQIEKQCDTIKTAYDVQNKNWELTKLRDMSLKWKCSYIILKGKIATPETALYSNGEYNVYRTNQ